MGYLFLVYILINEVAYMNAQNLDLMGVERMFSLSI